MGPGCRAPAAARVNVKDMNKPTKTNLDRFDAITDDMIDTSYGLIKSACSMQSTSNLVTKI